MRTAAFKPAHQCRVSPRFRVAAFWRKISTNKKVRCEEGDPLGRIIQNIMDQVIIGALEPVANGMVDALNAILVPTIWWLGFNKIGRICHTPDYEPIAAPTGRSRFWSARRSPSASTRARACRSCVFSSVCKLLSSVPNSYCSTRLTYFVLLTHRRRICSDQSLYDGYQ